MFAVSEFPAPRARVVLRCNSSIAALNAAFAGMDIAALPCFLADAEPGLRRLTPTIIGRRDLCLVYMPAAGRIGRVRAVIDFIAESTAERVAMLRGDSPASSADAWTGAAAEPHVTASIWQGANAVSLQPTLLPGSARDQNDSTIFPKWRPSPR